MTEKWIGISGYESIYLVSSLGRIKSLPRGKKRSDKILKNVFNKHYEQVDLCQNGTIKRYLVHRLVAISFIPNPENKPQVNHINGIKTDNRVENLEWVTRSENQLHSIMSGLRSARGIKNSGAKITEQQAMLIFKDERKYKEISEEYGLKISSICAIKRGDSWNHITGLPPIRKTPKSII